MATPEITIPLGELDAGGKAFRFPLRTAWLRSALVDSGEVEIPGGDGLLDVRASKSGNDVVVHGHVEAELQVSCARCLAPARVTVSESVSLLFVPSSSQRTGGGATKSEDGDLTFEEEEADVYSYQGETVVLDDVVRDELLLGIPMIPLCSPDCPGMQPTVNRNREEDAFPALDPRLAPLLKFKADKE
jgi:uncharacterized protein